MRIPLELVALSKTRETPGFHFRLPNHGHLDEECMALLYGKSSKFQLYNLLSWNVAQDHFYREVGVQVNISWCFFCFTYTYVEFIHSELICRGETVLAIYDKCNFFWADQMTSRNIPFIPKLSQWANVSLGFLEEFYSPHMSFPFECTCYFASSKSI